MQNLMTVYRLGNINLPMQTFCYPESLSLFQANTPTVLETLTILQQCFWQLSFYKRKIRTCAIWMGRRPGTSDVNIYCNAQ